MYTHSNILFLSIDEYFFICIYHKNVLIYSPVDGYLGCFLFSMIMTKGTMSIPKQNCVCTCFHFSWINFRE